MKIVSYQAAHAPSFGALVGDRIIDIPEALAASGEPNDALETSSAPRDAASLLSEPALLARAVAAVEEFVTKAGSAGGLSFADAVILPAIVNPPKTICLARNYAAHAAEAGRELSEIPILFARFTASLLGHKQPIVRPIVSNELDWEGELAVVIGKPGRHIKRAQAMDHVGAYTIFHDATIRDYQFRVAQYTEGKNFSSTGPLGPFLVTPDEIGDPNALSIQTYVNGVLKQDGNTADMVFDIPTIIEQISTFLPLETGDVIAMGTPAGVGFKRQPPEFLKPGDVVEVRVSEIGSLINPVVQEVI